MNETFYMWKEKLLNSGRLITPHGDPHLWEYPVDQQFDTVEQATAWLEDEIVNAEGATDGTIEEMQSWVLVKVTLEEAPLMGFEPTLPKEPA